MVHLKRVRYAACFAFGIAIAAPVANAQAENDFTGKRIQLLVPYAAGGGADLYARFLGPKIAERLPGKPTLIIRNVEGAGAIAGSNQFQERAKPDGTDLIAASASVMLNFAFRDRRANYRLDEWIPIISSAQGTVVYSHKSLGLDEASDIKDLVGKEVVMGANNPTGGDLRILLALDLLGIKVKPIFGMNRGDVYPAFQRGEVNIDFSINNAFKEQVKPLVDQGVAVPLFTLGFADDSRRIVRDPAHPELPHFLEVYESVKGMPLSGSPLKAWNAIFNLNVMATRAILLPKGTPNDVVATYEKAVQKLISDIAMDPELGKTTISVLGEEPSSFGDAAVRNLRSAVVFDDEGFTWLKDWLKQRFDAKL
jgi:tripartite-type tricarboxylate transporter receptor subunit TctC